MRGRRERGSNTRRARRERTREAEEGVRASEEGDGKEGGREVVRRRMEKERERQ